MQSQTTLKHHATLVDDMAAARGLDLEEEILRGKLTVSELEDAVLRCTGCATPGDCAHWLAARADNALGEPPFQCRNNDLFAELKRA